MEPAPTARPQTDYEVLGAAGIIPVRGKGRPRLYTPEQAKEVYRAKHREYVRWVRETAREARRAMQTSTLDQFAK